MLVIFGEGCGGRSSPCKLEIKGEQMEKNMSNQSRSSQGSSQGSGKAQQGGSQEREHDEKGRFTAGDSESPSRQASGGRSNADNNPGNFANDRERAAEAGRKGGQNSQRGSNNDE